MTTNPFASDDALRTVARELVSRATNAPISRLVRLAGGRNNQVYRLETNGGASLILKRYFSDPRDPRDRLGAEWNFLTSAWSRGIRSIPEPLARDTNAQVGLYSFVEGRKLFAGEVSPSHIDASLHFLLAVNLPPRPTLAAASEACFTLAQHVDTVERRIERLRELDPDAPLAAMAQSFVSKRLLPSWLAVKSQLGKKALAAGLSLAHPLSPEESCVSPSDFGFHNALVDDAGRITFIDFEYSGLDDPAKLVSDFFCQPEVPVSPDYHAEFIARLANGLGLDERGRTRCRILLDTYRIKWTCIILNEFLALDASRRDFADPGDRASRCASQLAKAETQLMAIGS